MGEKSISKMKLNIKKFFKKGKKYKATKNLDTQDFFDLLIDSELKTIKIKSTNEYIGAVMVQPINVFGLRYNDQKMYLDILDMMTNSKKFSTYQIYSSETGADTKQYINVLNERQKQYAKI